MAWMTVTDYKNLTGVTLDDATVQQALDMGAALMKRYIFIKRIYYSTNVDDTQILSRSTSNFKAYRIYVGDNDMDGVITSGDINAYELDVDFNETDLNPLITSFNAKYGVVKFNTAVPTATNKVLYIEWYEAITDLELILPMMLEANKLEATNWLFTQIPFGTLQSGISQWTLNGVSVDFDQSAVKQVVEDNKARLVAIYNTLVPLITAKTPLQASPPANRMSSFMTTLNWRSNNTPVP